MAGIVALWCWVERPPWRRVAALGATLVPAFVLQAAVIGTSPLGFRMLAPIKSDYDRNLLGRLEISKVTIDSWLTRPLVGHGAGSINRLVVVRPSGKRIQTIWNGNLVLFVLHDSGLAGLGALVWHGLVVWRRSTRPTRGEADGPQTSSLTAPLLAVGGGLCFAFQFTHGLWLMYPYVPWPSSFAARSPHNAFESSGRARPGARRKGSRAGTGDSTRRRAGTEQRPPRRPPGQ